MPARFRFPLQPVLEHRERLEEERMVQVAAIERERVAAEQALREIQASITGAKHDLRDHLAPGRGPVQVSAARLQAHATIHLAVKAQQAAIRLAGVHSRLEVARKSLLEATTAKKAVEVLKARRYEEWKRERAKAEVAATDELAVMRHGRDEQVTT